MAKGDIRNVIQVHGELTLPKVNDAFRRVSDALEKLAGRAGPINFRSPINVNSDQPTVVEFNPTSGYGPGAIVAYDDPDDQSLWFVRGGVRDSFGVWTATATDFSGVALEDDGSISFYWNEQLTIGTQFTPLKTMNFAYTSGGGPFCITMGDATLPSPLNALGSLCWTQPDLWTLGGTTAENQRLRFWDNDSSHSMILGCTATWSNDFGIFFTGVNPQGFRIGQTTNYTKWDFVNSYFYPNADATWTNGTATNKWLDTYTGGLIVDSSAKAVSYTVTEGDCVIAMSASGGARTVNLPAAASNAGRMVFVKKTDSSANAVTVDGDAGELIDGATTQTLLLQYECLQLVCDGTAWSVV